MRQHAFDPLECMIMIAKNELPCGTCRGKNRTKYALPAGQHTRECPGTSTDCTCGGIGERICQSCFGDGRESVAPELRGYMASQLAKYVYPQFKAIESKGNQEKQRAPIQIVLVGRDTPQIESVHIKDKDGVIDAECE